MSPGRGVASSTHAGRHRSPSELNAPQRDAGVGGRGPTLRYSYGVRGWGRGDRVRVRRYAKATV